MNFDRDIHVPGLWRCALCNFVLMQSTLSAVDGTIGSRDEPGERCPNDNAPLWRVTWREHATELATRCESAIKEAASLREARTTSPTELRLPDEITPEIKEVLGTICFQVIPLVQAYRAGGHVIKARAEDEQAFAIWRFLKAIEVRGAKWRDVIKEEVEAMAAAASEAASDNASSRG